MSDRWQPFRRLSDELGATSTHRPLEEVALVLGIKGPTAVRDDDALRRLLVAIRLLISSGVVDEQFPGLAGLAENSQGLAAAESAVRQLLAGEPVSAVYAGLVADAGPEVALVVLGLVVNMVPGGGMLMRYLQNGLKQRRAMNRQASNNLGAMSQALRERMLELGLHLSAEPNSRVPNC